MKIKYKVGDVIKAAINTPDNIRIIIPHIVNNQNAFGAGFVVALSKVWSEPEARYRKAFSSVIAREDLLGKIQVVNVDRDLYVCNMFAQVLGSDADGNPPIRYEDLDYCLEQLNFVAETLDAEIWAPRFGAGLAGGDWSKIEELIENRSTVPVTIFDLK